MNETHFHGQFVYIFSSSEHILSRGLLGCDSV